MEVKAHCERKADFWTVDLPEFDNMRITAKRLDKAGSRDKQHGRIVLIGSITAEKIFPATSVYGATKAAVRHLGKALAREWARRGICVNVIQPGYFESEMTAELFGSETGAAMVFPPVMRASFQ